MGFLKKIDFGYSIWMGKVKQIHISRTSKKWIRNKISLGGGLTKNQIKQIQEVFFQYHKVDTCYHEYYTKMYGSFSPNFIPNDLYFNYIDNFYNDRKKAVVLENKCYFKRMFPTVRQPEIVCYRLNKFWYSAEDEVISFEKVKQCVSKEKTIVVKQAIGSSGGHAVIFIDAVEGNLVSKFVETINDIDEDIIVQRPVRQHPGLSILNDSSLNTLRVVSLLRENGVTVYSVVLRMGTCGMRVDNESSGGINCGVHFDGRLRADGHTKSGEIYKKHPSSKIVFENYQIPHLENVIKTVKQIHPLIPHFRLVSWDFAVAEDGAPVLIEANLNCGGININQVNNGPLFGDDTKAVLDEVFSK